MYKKIKATTSNLTVAKHYTAEPLEKKVSRILNNKEPIKDGAPLLYTDREEGILPEYDPRADKQEILIDAMDKRSNYSKSQREMRLGEKAFENMSKEQKQEFVTKYPNSQKSKDFGKEGTATSDTDGK